MPDAKVEVRSDSELVVKRGASERVVSLDNLRLRCASRDECNDNIATFASGVKATFEDSPPGPAKVLLTVKNVSFVELSDRSQKPKDRVARRPFIGDLKIVYVFESEMGMRFVTASDQEQLGLDDHALYELARKNLARKFPTMFELAPLGPDAVSNGMENDYAAALLVLPEIWRPIEKKLGAPLLVSVPARSFFFAISGTVTSDSLQKFEAVTARAFREEDHALSGRIFELGADGFHERTK